MGNAEKIDIDVFKTVTRAIAESDDLEIMTGHLTQLLVGTLEIKGCSIFALEPASGELELLSSFGLSIGYLNKGPVFSDKSIGDIKKGKPVIIRDLRKRTFCNIPRKQERRESAPSFHCRLNSTARISELCACIIMSNGKFLKRILTLCWCWPKISVWP